MDLIASPVWLMYWALAVVYIALAFLPWRPDSKEVAAIWQVLSIRAFILIQALWTILFGLNNSGPAWQTGHGPISWSFLSDVTMFMGYMIMATMFRLRAGRRFDIWSGVLIGSSLLFGAVIPAFLDLTQDKLHITTIAILCVWIEGGRWIYAYSKKEDNPAATILLYATIFLGGIALFRSVVLFIWPDLMPYNQAFLNFLLPLISLSMIVLSLASNVLSTQQKLADLATFDSLTGLFNRRAFSEHFKTYVQDRLHQKHQNALLVADVDHFKSVNDTYGHGVGDIVLKEVALKLQKGIRAGDRIARYGGEEFVCLVTNCQHTDVELVIARLQAELETVNVPELKADDRSLTLCFGVLLFTGPLDFNQAFGLADANLYQAKEEGRNRAIFSSYQQEVAQQRSNIQNELELQPMPKAT